MANLSSMIPILLENGTLKLYGVNNDNVSKIAEFPSDITKIDGNASTVIGLKSDGTIICRGLDSTTGTSQYNNLTGCVEIGLGWATKADGTYYLNPNIISGTSGKPSGPVANWTNIKKFYRSSSFDNSIGVIMAALRNDGTIYIDDNTYGLTTSGFTSIASFGSNLYSSLRVLIGIRTNGTVVATAVNGTPPAVSGWTNIKSVYIFAGPFVVGLKTDGSIVSTGSPIDTWMSSCKSWKNIRMIYTNTYSVLFGVTNANTVLCTDSGTTMSANTIAYLTRIRALTNISEIFHCSNTTFIAKKIDGSVIYDINADYTASYDMSALTQLINPSIVKVEASNSFAFALDVNGWHFFGNLPDYNACSTWKGIRQIATTGNTLIGLKFDGTLEVANNTNIWFKPNNFTNVKYVTANTNSVACIKKDGTCYNERYYKGGIGSKYNMPLISTWTNMKQLSCSSRHTAGLTNNGTVIVVYDTNGGTYSTVANTGTWTDIKQIQAVEFWATIGLKNNGTLVVAGSDGYNNGRLNITGWTNIKQFSTSISHSVGLKYDGTVIATGTNNYNECNVSGWTNVAYVMAGDSFTIGIKNDGTVLKTGDDSYTKLSQIPSSIIGAAQSIDYSIDAKQPKENGSYSYITTLGV